MKRTLAFSLGPELIWVLTYGLAAFLVRRNRPPSEVLNHQLVLAGWILTLAGALLSFLPLTWMPGNKWLLLLRIFISGMVGVFAVSLGVCGGIDYGDSRNSGLAAAFALFLGAGFVAVVAGELLAAFFLITKWRVLPFVKWSFVMLTVLAILWGIICWLASLDPKKQRREGVADQNRPSANKRDDSR
ncbi:MAG: hypothetical protein L0Z50_29505 [Verrucomicrobiales bacterium]|nr:hypothetical protein [Verrucomicrobiales bacterium]